MRYSFVFAAGLFALCGACREPEPSTKDKELDVQLAQAKARQAEAEAEKAAIEARAGRSPAPATPSNVAAPNAVAVAQIAVKKYAFEAFGEWSQKHPDKSCPDELEDLGQYLGARDNKDPWGHPYRMFCGQNLPAGAKAGLAVMSLGPDGKDGTDDDIKSW